MISFGSCHEFYEEVDPDDVVDLGGAEAALVDTTASFFDGVFGFEDEMVGFVEGLVVDAMLKLIIEERDE